MLNEESKKLIARIRQTSDECPMVYSLLEIIDKLIQEIEEKEKSLSCIGCKWDDERWHSVCFECCRMGNDCDKYEEKEE